MERLPREYKSYPQEFKLAAVGRMAAGETVAALARELGVLRKCLYAWRDQLRLGGPEALRPQKRGPKPRGDRVGPARDIERRAGSFEAPEPRAAAVSEPAVAPAAVAPPAEAQQRIAALEQKIGQQALDLDFFRAALRHFRATRQPSDGSGVPASTRSSEP